MAIDAQDSGNQSFTLTVKVVFSDRARTPVRKARLLLVGTRRESAHVEAADWGVTNSEGKWQFTRLKRGTHYRVYYCHYYENVTGNNWVEFSGNEPDQALEQTITIDFAPDIEFFNPDNNSTANHARVNDLVNARITGLPPDPGQEHITVQALDPLWERMGEEAAALSFYKVMQKAGKDICKFVVHSLPVDANVKNIIERDVPASEPFVSFTISAVVLSDPPGDDGANVTIPLQGSLLVLDTLPTPVTGRVDVAKLRTGSAPTEQDALFSYVHRSTEALSFNNYLDFTDALFCNSRLRRHEHRSDSVGAKLGNVFRRHGVLDECWHGLSFVESDAYRVLKAATEAFVMVHCGVVPPRLRHHNADGWRTDLLDDDTDERNYIGRRDLTAYSSFDTAMQKYLESSHADQRMLPYLAIIRRKLADVPIDHIHGLPDADLCYGIIQRKLASPCMIELLWSYWHEEAMLVQTMNVLTQRFQNVRASGPLDPLANLAIDPLRPLNNLIWGYINDELGRLTVARRGFEYDHEYGLRLEGRAIPNFASADSRSRFLEAFHVLLRLCTTFYRQDDDTNIKADAFPVLNALKEVHLILSQGADNQFGDLPTTARVEMLMQQWLLARPEFREFLPTKLMVAYPEPWMDRVDAMKKLQGWTDTSVIHFHHLARFGEQLLLSIRYGNWSVLYEPNEAFNWARYWRPQVQGYIHAYRAVTGHDLSSDAHDPAADGTLPSVLLRRRLAQQQQAAGLAGMPGQLALEAGQPQQLGPAQPLPLGQQQPRLLARPVRGNPS